MEGKVYQAKGPFLVSVDGHQVAVQRGTTVREGHPLLSGREHLFEPFTVDFEWTPAAVSRPADVQSGTPRTRTAKTAE